MRPTILAALLLAAAVPAARADDAESGVLRATLDNGLRVIVVRNTLSPVVTTSVNSWSARMRRRRAFRAPRTPRST
jgi:hypothetical protein